MSKLTIQEVQTAYLAFFGRPADQEGLAYWTSSAHNGGSSSMWTSFALVPEYVRMVDGKSTAEIVEIFYLNLFDRPADPQGKAFWLDEIFAGRVSVSKITIALIEGAKGPSGDPKDAALIASKIAANTVATQFLPNFLLSTGTDKLVGTAKNDIFMAVINVDDSTKTTLTSVDSILDASNLDLDTLIIETNGHIGKEHTATIRGIETINVRLNTVTTTDGLEVKIAIDNIHKASKLVVQNVATKSVINKATVTGDQGVALEFDQTFQFVSTDTTGDSSIKLNAKGTIGAAATITMAGAAKNVTTDAAGQVLYEAQSATGLLTLKAVNNATISGAKHVAANLDAGGNITLANLSEAVIVTANAGGSIVATEASALSKATTLKLTAGHSITASKLKLTTDAEVAARNSIVLAEDNANNLKSVKVTNLANSALTVDLVGVGNGLTSIQALGNSDIVMGLNTAKLTKLNNIQKGNSGRLDINLAGQAGDADLSYGSVNSFKLEINNMSKTLTLASGQTLTVAAAQGSVPSTSTIASKTFNGNLTLRLDDGKKDGVSVDLVNVMFRNYGVIIIDASIDSTAAGTASRSKIENLTLGNTDTTNVVINAGINGIELNTVTLTSGNQLLINGGGPINGVSANLTANRFDASAVTGPVNLKMDGTKLNHVITGSGNDTIVVAKLAPNIQVTTGSGNDTIDLTAAIGATATRFLTVTDFAPNSSLGQIVDRLTGFGGTTVISGDLVPAGSTAQFGVLTKNNATLNDFVSVMAGINTNKDTKKGILGAFKLGSDLYIYSTGADGSTPADDVMVKLVGVGLSGVGLEATASTPGFVTIGT